jgi:uncharacterized membrane-anchored protein
MFRALPLAALAGFLCFATTPSLAEQAPYPKDETARRAELDAMNWLSGPSGYEVETSHSTMKAPESSAVLLGKDAQRYEFLINGVEFPNTEMVIYDPASEVEISVEFHREGFVKDDDWSEVDADDFLKQLIEGQRESNKRRSANGQEAFDVIGWLERPSYDPVKHVAHYVLELGTAQRHWLNAVAVKLGREGYHQFTWVGDTEQYKHGGPAVLAATLDSHSYAEGYRYVDVKSGDKVAAYGIAGLVAAVAGVKLGKGLLAGALAFLAIAGKKLAILAVPALIGIRAAVKRFFRRS